MHIFIVTFHIGTLLWGNHHSAFGLFHGRLARWRKWRACDIGKRKKGWRMSCDVGEVTKVGEWALLLCYKLEHGRLARWIKWRACDAEFILQPFLHFTYITTHSPTLPSLYLRHSSFSNPSVVLPTSQFILQPFFRFSYVTSSSLNSPGEPPMK